MMNTLVTTEDTNISNIYSALNEVMKQVGYVQKMKAARLNYTYAGEAALISAIRPHFVEQGIVVHPLEVKTINQDNYMTSNNNLMNRTAVIMVYRFTHAESGTFIDVAVTGEGSDVGDKSANKALTGAYKYALRQTLMIETGDDPDQFPSDVQAERQTTTNGQRKPVAKAKVEPPMPTAAMKKHFHAIGVKIYGDLWDDKRPELTKAISGKRKDGPVVTSSNELFRAEMQELINGMSDKLNARTKQEAADG